MVGDNSFSMQNQQLFIQFILTKKKKNYYSIYGSEGKKEEVIDNIALM